MVRPGGARIHPAKQSAMEKVGSLSEESEGLEGVVKLRCERELG